MIVLASSIVRQINVRMYYGVPLALRLKNITCSDNDPFGVFSFASLATVVMQCTVRMSSTHHLVYRTSRCTAEAQA